MIFTMHVILVSQALQQPLCALVPQFQVRSVLFTLGAERRQPVPRAERAGSGACPELQTLRC